MSRVPSELSVPLGDFAVKASRFIRSEEEASLAAVARQALYYYLSDHDSGRVGWSYPRFLPGIGDVSTVTVPIDVDVDAWRDFTREAKRQGVSPELLLRHAVLYYSADVDSGRVARRLIDDGL